MRRGLEFPVEELLLQEVDSIPTGNRRYKKLRAPGGWEGRGGGRKKGTGNLLFTSPKIFMFLFRSDRGRGGFVFSTTPLGHNSHLKNLFKSEEEGRICMFINPFWPLITFMNICLDLIWRGRGY